MHEVVQGDPPGLSGDRTRRRIEIDAFVLGAILLIGAGLRCAYLHELEQSPYFSLPAIDPAFHDDWARALTGLYPADAVPGQYGPGQPANEPFMRPPAYPHFLALAYLLTRGSYLGAYAAQMGLGLVNAVLVFFLARRMFGRAPAILSAFGMAVYWALIYNEGELHAVVLMIFFALLLFLALQQWLFAHKSGWGFAAGVVMGLLALTGPVTLAFLPVAALWMGTLEWRRLRSRRFLVAPALFLAGYALGVLPAQARNYWASGDWVIMAPVGGINFFIGNNPKATGVFSWDYPEYGGNGACYEFIEMRHVLGKKLGRTMSVRDLSDFFRDKALDYIRERPKDALRLTLKKALMFWGPVEWRHNKAVELDRAHSAVLSRIPGDFPALLTLFLLGSVLFIGQERRRLADREAALPLLLLVFVAVYFLGYVPFFVNAQFRAPLAPFLILFGAYGLCRVASFGMARRYVLAAGCIAGGGLAYAVCSFPFVPYDAQDDRCFWHFDRGLSFSKLGKTQDAIAEYRGAIDADPGCFAAYTNLARALALDGQYDAAMSVCEQARSAGPTFDWTYFDVGDKFVQPFAKALDDAFAKDPAAWPPALLTEPGLSATREVAFGLACLRRFSEICPEGRRAAYQALAKGYAALGQTVDAIEAYAQAAALCPTCQTERMQFAALLCAQKREDEAISTLREALAASPDSASLQAALGLALVRANRAEDAARAFRRALALDPELAWAREQLIRVEGNRPQAATESSWR